ncbi:uncharacterized protein VP01_3760g1 [Puccinia sorghi]|uniref:Uncharacterized protein n=1 Tax=Puccinia sorghi TaxID=27349 RepID=A0A0L6UVP8_9BASI|nr:uncharacterized protein VP01_3760g1 [Puccinia sorghi]
MPLAWHHSRTAVLTRKRCNNCIQELLIDRGFNQDAWIGKHCPLIQEHLDKLKYSNPELINIRYDSQQASKHPPMTKLHLDMTKEDAVEATKQLVLFVDSSLDSLAIYTDGSFDSEKGGAGAVICSILDIALTSALGTDPYISNHECEAIGLLLVLKLLRIPQQPHSPAYIFTENKGIPQRVPECNKETTGQYLFNEIKETLEALPEQKRGGRPSGN